MFPSSLTSERSSFTPQQSEPMTESVHLFKEEPVEVTEGHHFHNNAYGSKIRANTWSIAVHERPLLDRKRDGTCSEMALGEQMKRSSNVNFSVKDH